VRVEPTELEGVLHIVPRVFGDARGFFLETFHAARYADHGVTCAFVQDNASRSAPGTVRGLHLQQPGAQAKLVYVLDGRVLDVAVDVRVGSPTFGRHVARALDGERKNQLFIPAGFAHGFAVLGDAPALFAYKCSEPYRREDELSVAWNDPRIGIDWGLERPPLLSDRDRDAPRLADVDEARLPRFAEVP